MEKYKGFLFQKKTNGILIKDSFLGKEHLFKEIDIVGLKIFIDIAYSISSEKGNLIIWDKRRIE